MNIDVSSLLMFRLEFVYIYFLILGFKTAIKFQLIYAAYGLFNLSIIQFDDLICLCKVRSGRVSLWESVRACATMINYFCIHLHTNLLPHCLLGHRAPHPSSGRWATLFSAGVVLGGWGGFPARGRVNFIWYFSFSAQRERKEVDLTKLFFPFWLHSYFAYSAPWFHVCWSSIIAFKYLFVSAISAGKYEI